MAKSLYPASVDKPDLDQPLDKVLEDLQAGLINTQTEMGVDPAGSAATVVARMDATDTLSGISAGAVSGGMVAETNVTIVESGNGAVHKSVITATDLVIVLGNTTAISFGAVKVATWPAGIIQVLGSVLSTGISYTFPGTGSQAEPLVGTMGGDFSFGTSATADSTLDGTMVNLIPSTSIDPLSTPVGANLAAIPALFDGHTTAAFVELNHIIDDADVTNGHSENVLVSFVLELIWINAGDF